VFQREELTAIDVVRKLQNCFNWLY